MLGGTFISIYTIKYINNKRRDDKYKPLAMIPNVSNGTNSANEKWDYYDNLAQIKPGFPIRDPRKKLDGNDENEFKRKSKYEAGGVAAVTRKRGDRLGFWNRRQNDQDNDS